MFDMRAPMMAVRSCAPSTMRVFTWQKDMDIIGAFARGLGLPLPLFQAGAPIYSAAMQAEMGNQGTAAVFAVLDPAQPKHWTQGREPRPATGRRAVAHKPSRGADP